MEVRLVRPEEYEEAGRSTAAAYEEFATPGDPDWDGYLREIADIGGRAGRLPVLVAVEDGRILGSATLELDDAILGDDDAELPPDTVSLRMLGVDPTARGRGAGRALVEASIAEARARGKRHVVLRTTPPMTIAQRLYESMGFVPDPERDLVFDSGFRLLAYRLAL
jgi:ribosomal protein S18 acetylase RimI-like enzyme